MKGTAFFIFFSTTADAGVVAAKGGFGRKYLSALVAPGAVAQDKQRVLMQYLLYTVGNKIGFKFYCFGIIINDFKMLKYSVFGKLADFAAKYFWILRAALGIYKIVDSLKYIGAVA